MKRKYVRKEQTKTEQTTEETKTKTEAIDYPIFTTRFSQETWDANVRYRQQAMHNGCIYANSMQISHKYQRDQRMLVIEMNNTINHVEGVGLISCRSKIEELARVFHVYDNPLDELEELEELDELDELEELEELEQSDESEQLEQSQKKDLNRFVHQGQYRLDRADLPTELLESLEDMCFRGKGHFKRLQGIIKIAPHTLQKHFNDSKREVPLYDEFITILQQKYRRV